MRARRPRGTQIGGRQSRGRRSAWVGVVAVACVCAAMLATSWLAPRAAADGRPPGGRLGDPVVRAVDTGQPAIVRLATIYTARITFTLCGQDVTLPASGDGYTLGATGSGAFISAHGDILTADHVVDVPTDLLEQAIFQEPDSASDIAHLLDTNPGCHAEQPISASDVAAGYVQYAGIAYTVHYSAPRRLVWQSTAYSGSVSNATKDSILAGLLAVPHLDAAVVSASSVNDNDAAIVHVDLDDTPSIQLDNSASVAVDDQLTIIGYPGNGDVTNDGTDLLTPSVNDITVSAIKAGDNGEPLIQVGGNVEHGDSGGPALDAQGHIVGIVSFGFVGPDSPGSTAFLRSSNSVRSLIAGANINTAPGAFERDWERAFADYAATYAGHWGKAAGELDALHTRYPAFHGIQPFQDYADAAASVEATPLVPLAVLEVAAGGVALVALLALIAGVLLVRARGRRRRLAVAHAGSVPPFAGAYNYGFGYGYGNGYGYGAAPSAPAAYAPSWYAPGGYAPAAYSRGGDASATAPAPAPPLRQPGQENGYAEAQAERTPPIASTPSPSGRPPAEPAWTYTRTAAPSGSAPPHAAEHVETGVMSRNAYCVGGHPMAAQERYCAQCGAPRWSTDAPAARGGPGGPEQH